MTFGAEYNACGYGLEHTFHYVRRQDCKEAKSMGEHPHFLLYDLLLEHLEIGDFLSG